MPLNAEPPSAPIRLVLGAFVGFTFGVVGELLLKGPYDPEGETRFLWTGAVTGALSGAGSGVFVGGWRLSGMSKWLGIGLVVGLILGAVGGVLVSSALFSRALALREPLDDKDWASYRTLGILFGTPIGSLLGTALGLGVGMLRKCFARPDGPADRLTGQLLSPALEGPTGPL